jgi:predicted DNA-binding transcriptional regulator YafY
MKALLDRLIRLDILIQKRVTGNPVELAKKIGISERSVYDYIRMMKDMGAPIKFCRSDRTYEYEENGHLNIRFRQKNSDS